MVENGSRPRVIIDCDPGVDDAIALMVAAAPTAGFELAGVTAVAGNLPLDDTFRNARSLMAFLGKHDVPVHAAGAPDTRRTLEIVDVDRSVLNSCDSVLRLVFGYLWGGEGGGCV